MSNNPGLKTLENCERQVTITIRNNLESIAGFLRDKKIITRILHNEVTDMKSHDSKDDRAKILYQELCKKVEENDDIYLTFVGYIRDNQDSG